MGVRYHRERPALPGREPDLAARNAKGPAPQGRHLRSAERMACAAPGVPAQAERRDQRQPRPAHPGRRKAAFGAFRRSGRGPPSILIPSRRLHRRPVAAFRSSQIHDRRPRSHDSWLHGLGLHRLRVAGLGHHLARGQTVDPGAYRSARQGGQIPLRACKGQRVRGRDRPSARREAGKAPPEDPGRGSACHHAPHREPARGPYLGDGRLWLDCHYRAAAAGGARRISAARSRWAA